jgi:hypothetical protein
MAKSQNPRGRRGIAGPPGRPGRRGPRGATGTTGARGRTGAAGDTGAAGLPGAGTLDERMDILTVVQEQIDDVHQELDLQRKRISQLQVQVDDVCAKVAQLIALRTTGK